MKEKNFKRTLVISGLYVLLLAVLIVGISLARYQDARIAYTSFGAANFNAIILGENTVADMTDPSDPVVNRFGVNLRTTDYHPGMRFTTDPQTNTAQTLGFSVANGTGSNDCSQVSVEYSLRLRTLDNLPLKYTLALGVEDEHETGGGRYAYFSAGEPRRITDDAADAGTWYEYQFFPEDTENPSEAVFELQGGSLRLNSYKLIVEWPVTDGGGEGTDSNSPAYMKEVELVEILATVSSKNMLTEDGYLDTTVPGQETVYSTGIIILHPDEGTPAGDGTGAVSRQYAYDIDFRSFAPDGNARSFTFTVENGVGKGRAHTLSYTHYDVLLKIPVNDKTDEYSYTVYADGSEEGTLLGTPLEYRLYHEIDGTYEVLPGPDYPEGKSEPDYRLYAVYSLSSNRMLVNRINNPSGSGQISFEDSDTFTLSIARKDSSQIENSELQSICFDNKLEILTEAEFNDVPN